MATYHRRRYFWWPWDKELVEAKWQNTGYCPYCGVLQCWRVERDDSFRLTWTGFNALVSCANHECGKQIALNVRGMRTISRRTANG